MNQRRIRRLMIPGMAAMVAAGCGRPAGPILDAQSPAWPGAPDVSRIRYLGQVATDQDLKPARAAGKRVGEFLLGKDPMHAMLSPIGLAVSGSRLFVADSNGQVLHVFDLETRAYAQWRPAKDQLPFSMPVGVACDAGGNVYVTDSVGGVVQVFDRSGKRIRAFGQGLLQRPSGIVIDGERVLIVDTGAHQVIAMSLDGKEVTRIGRRGTGLGEFNYPTHIARGGDGSLYVSDSLNFRVQVLTPDLTPVRQVGRKGDMPGYFSQPKGVAVDPDNQLYVVDANFEAVQVFDPAGSLLLTFGHEGTGPGEFWLPAGICFDGSGRLFVADTYNRRIQVFQYLRESP